MNSRPMSNIDKRALREVAEKAGANEWCAFIDTKSKTYSVHTPGDNRCGDVVKWAGFDGQQRAAAKAKFIAAANPATVLALLDELEDAEKYAKDRDAENEGLMLTVGRLRVEREAAEKRIAEHPGQKRLIGWRMADYTDETADPALAKNWATAVDVLPIFEGDVNTKLSAAAAGKGE